METIKCKLKKRIDKSDKVSILDICFFLLLFPLFSPSVVMFSSSAIRIYHYLLTLSFLCITSIFIVKSVILSIIPFSFVVGLEGTLLLATVFNGENIWASFYQIIAVVSIAETFLIYISQEDKILKMFMTYFEFFIYINFLTIMFFPDGFVSRYTEAYGMTKEWFLGASNNLIFWVLPACTVAMLVYSYSERRIRPLLLVTVCVTTELWKGSSTGIVAIIVFVGMLLIPILHNIITPYRMTATIAVFLFIVVFVNKTEFLKPFIEGVLHKELTFSNRTYIWTNAINAIAVKPILGHGLVFTDRVVLILGKLPKSIVSSGIWEGATHCHNQYLQILFQTGLIGIIWYTLMLIYNMAVCQKYWNNWKFRIAFFGLFCYMLISVFEVTETPLMYIIIFAPWVLNSSGQSKPEVKILI